MLNHPDSRLKIEELMPFFSEILSRSVLKNIIKKTPKITLYWRTLTPMVMLWCFIMQRLKVDHSCDEMVSYLHSGGADGLDQDDPHEQPLSQRLQSESSSAYAQGRARLPLTILQKANQKITQQITTWQGEQARWKGLVVRLLDGTTFRLPPNGDLVKTYGRPKNQHGASHWVKVRSVALFDLMSQALVAIEEAAFKIGETSLVYALLKQDKVPSLCLADANFGMYRVLQAIVATDKDGLLRMASHRAKKLLKDNQLSTQLPSGTGHRVVWTPSEKDQLLPGLAAPSVVGRLIFVRVQQDGFRPFDLYLFTTLSQTDQFPIADICHLYCQRWRVEIDFRHLKTSLHMEYFAVQSAAMFRKELAAGCLAYNLICAFMVQAAFIADLPPNRLSFKQCWRRVRSLLLHGLPPWVWRKKEPLQHFLQRLARCKIQHAKLKVLHEPRKVRLKPRVYGHLKGSRDDARAHIFA